MNMSGSIVSGYRPRPIRRAAILGLVAFFSLAFAATAPRAEEVTIKHNGLRLNADLVLAEGKTIEDGIIMITHALLFHKNVEALRVITGLFNEKGYSTLAMTYSAGLDNRRGPYDCAVPHRHSVAGHVAEIGAWLDWVKSQGARRVVLAGHSTGANRMTRFIVKRNDPAVTKMILFAPVTGRGGSQTEEGYKTRYRTDLSVILERSRKLVEAGKGDEMMEDIDFLYCAKTSVTARSFLGYYALENRIRESLPGELRALPKPALVIAAGEDNIAPDMARLVEPFIDGKHIKLVLIEGCGHFFRDLCADDAVDAAVAYLEE